MVSKVKVSVSVGVRVSVDRWWVGLAGRTFHVSSTITTS